MAAQPRTANPASIEKKARALESIAKEIAQCPDCRRGKSGLPVPGEGNPDARIAFIGMAPGREEARTGRPFVGRSGVFLDRMLALIGIRRDSVFITSPLKYFPGKKAVKAGDISHGRTHLERQLGVISPRIVVLMGDVAVKALLPDEGLAVSSAHGRIYVRGPAAYFVTFHPAAAMRFPKIRKVMESDFRKLRALIFA